MPNSVQLIPKFSLEKLNVELEVSTFIVFLTKHWMSWDECSENLTSTKHDLRLKWLIDLEIKWKLQNQTQINPNVHKLDKLNCEHHPSK